MTTRYDLAVIGGGLVGAAVAWGLRALGARMIVLDAGDARAASYGTFGLVWVQGKGLGLPAYVAWTVGSARAWPRLAATLREETGLDVALEQRGGVHPCLSRQECDARAAHLDRLFAQAGVERYEASILSGDALRERVPALGPAVAGGSFSPLDGHCDPLRLWAALQAGLSRAGVVRRRARVSALEASASGFRIGIDGADPVEADRVVVAAGRATTALAEPLGMHVPLVADTGQVMALERMQPFLPLPLTTMRQTADGSVLVGDSHEARDDGALDLPVLGGIARRAQAIVPALAQARVVRAWASTRVMPADGFPVYAQSPRWPGAFAVACHSGVTLAAAHAFDLAPALQRGALPASLAPFAAARFPDVRAAA